MLAKACTFALLGVGAVRVDVEVDLHSGLPTFSVVGLPDAAVRESRERVRAAILNSGFDFPQMRIAANLAPADLRKVGPSFDLAIAAALLAAQNELDPRGLERWWLAGELALDGSIRPVHGILAMAEEARRQGTGGIAVPVDNAAEAALIEGLEVAPLSRLAELVGLARGGVPAPIPPLPDDGPYGVLPDLADLRGQPWLRRALEVAAAGGHNLLVLGPPGAGKSLAARRIPSILPPLTHEETIEVTRIHSVAGLPVAPGALASRPFRAPHHTISQAGLVGGGTPPRPGEITLAHRGVLFLDEIGEFARSGLEALRQPLEDGRITIVRARHALSFPAGFQLVAAANPCPCGRGASDAGCQCGEEAIARYRGRISGALSDRIDITVSIGRPDADAMAGDPGERSAPVCERVAAARERQGRRLGPGRANASMSPVEIRRHAGLDREAERTLRDGHRSQGLSGRGWDRVLRLARTLADLDGADRVSATHVAEALSLRRRGD